MADLMNDKEQAIFIAAPKPPEGGAFTLQKVQQLALPHPYCIGAKHVTVASDSFGGRLNADAIRDAESKGATCCVCKELSKREGRDILSYDQHEVSMTAFLSVPKKISRLTDVPGLHEWLVENKSKFETLGVTGFAFPFNDVPKGTKE